MARNLGAIADDEFVDTFASRQEMLDYWQKGWTCLTEALDALQSADLVVTVKIRGESLSVSLAIARSLSHCGYHVGQIVLISRLLVNDGWKTLTIPKGASKQHNTKNWGGTVSELNRFHLKKLIDPDGTRTRVTAVKGRCPRPLDDGANAYHRRDVRRKFFSGTVVRLDPQRPAGTVRRIVKAS